MPDTTPEAATSREAVTTLLLKCEAMVHRGGWDQPPFLAVLDLINSRMMALSKIPMEIHNPPGVHIHWLGQQMLVDEELPLALLGNSHFFGMAFVSEAWTVARGTPEKRINEIHAEVRASRIRLADIPEGSEIRFLYAVDVLGRVYFVSRRRGEKPEAESEDSMVHYGGRVIHGLLNMTKSVAAQMPDAERYLAALADAKISYSPTAREGDPEGTES